MRYYDPYNNLRVISKKHVEEDWSRWVWFGAPNKEKLLNCIKKVKDGCPGPTPVRGIWGTEPRKVLIGFPNQSSFSGTWEGIGFKIERIMINERHYAARVWLADDVFFISRIIIYKCHFLGL